MVVTEADIRTDAQGRHLVVCDNGTGLVKVGYAHSQFPQFVFPSIVGTPQLKTKAKLRGKEIELKDIMCGDKASELRQYLEIVYPMDKGAVKNWEAMGHLWDYWVGVLKVFSDFGPDLSGWSQIAKNFSLPYLRPRKNELRLHQHQSATDRTTHERQI